jgi:hypothetical protein
MLFREFCIYVLHGWQWTSALCLANNCHDPHFFLPSLCGFLHLLSQMKFTDFEVKMQTYRHLTSSQFVIFKYKISCPWILLLHYNVVYMLTCGTVLYVVLAAVCVIHVYTRKSTFHFQRWNFVFFFLICTEQTVHIYCCCTGKCFACLAAQALPWGWGPCVLIFIRSLTRAS